jgi:hypothetical protein
MEDNYENAQVERVVIYNVIRVPYNQNLLNNIEIEAYIRNAQAVSFNGDNLLKNAMNIWFRSRDIAAQGAHQGFMHLFFNSEIPYGFIINYDLPNYMCHIIKNNGVNFCFRYYFGNNG